MKNRKAFFLINNRKQSNFGLSISDISHTLAINSDKFNSLKKFVIDNYVLEGARRQIKIGDYKKS